MKNRKKKNRYIPEWEMKNLQKQFCSENYKQNFFWECYRKYEQGDDDSIVIIDLPGEGLYSELVNLFENTFEMDFDKDCYIKKIEGEKQNE